MYDQYNDGGRKGLPVLTGVLVGLSVATLAICLFMVFKAPSLIREQADKQIAREIAELRLDKTMPWNSGSIGDAALSEGRNNSVVTATEKVAPAVVSIQVTQVTRYVARPRSLMEWFETYGRPQVRERDISNMGSGVLVSPYGRVVTNNHVVNGAKNITVTLSDGRQFPARILDSSAKHDISLLQLDLPEGELLPYAELGNSDDLRIGEWAIAIGSPFGFQLGDIRPSVTVGVISALHREIKASDEARYTDMIQTDAAINPGNSGGPLINSEGKVIGINTLIFTKDGGSLGIGFARPVNKVVWILNEFERYGEVRDTWAGFEGQDLKPYHVVHNKLKANQGVFVTKVFNGGPAAAAGLLPGDVVTAIGGQSVDNLGEGNQVFYRYEVGDSVDFTVDRRGEVMVVSVVLEEYKTN
jgi:S1-C subfamily serine protease